MENLAEILYSLYNEAVLKIFEALHNPKEGI